MLYLPLISLYRRLFCAATDEELRARLLAAAWLYLLLVALQSRFFPAPYGKFNTRNPVHLIEVLRKLTLSPQLSWFLMEVPSFLVGLMAMIHLHQLGDTHKIFLMIPFTFHYFNRSIIYPLSLNNGQPFPVLASSSAFVFTLSNGVLQTLSITAAHTEPRLLAIPTLGLVTFLLGMALNIHSDAVLRRLRRGGAGYQVPRGGGFELVACPHYLGEAVEWLGWAAMVATPAAAWFATFTAVFLGSRAVATHRWYHDKFREEYPATRRAFIPFIL